MSTLSLKFNNSAGSLQVRLPIIGTGVFATIDWGDTETSTGVDPNVTTHTYPASGYPSPIAIVTITSGTVTTFGSAGWPGVANLMEVATSDPATWGLGTAVTSFANLFRGASSLTLVVPIGIPLSVTNMNSMFDGASAFNGNIVAWDVSSVTNMDSMFNGASAFNQNIGGWDVSKVTDMSSMFNGASVFNQNIGGWDVSSVLTMSRMFYDASAFNNNGSALSWSTGTGTSNVTSMGDMFYGASVFNQNIGGWDVSNVTSMSSMFNGASAFNNNGSALSWSTGTGTSNVTSMSNMFNGASAFNQNIGAWNVSSVTEMASMFRDASAFNQNIGAWNVSIVTNMYTMFTGAVAFNQNIRYWSVQNGTTLTLMFSGATAFHTKFYPTTPGYNTTNATPLYTFFNVPIPLSLTFNNSLGSLQVRLPIIGTGVTATIDWGDGTTNTGVDPNVTTHTYPASGYPSPTAIVTITSSATSVTTFGSVGWPGVVNLTAVSTNNNTTWGLGTNVTSFANLFNGASPLRSVPTGIPLSVIDMTRMFNDAIIFNQNIRYWSVQNGDNLSDMFSGATAMDTTYTGTTGFGTTPLYTFFNVPLPTLSLRFNNSTGSLQVRLPIIGTGVNANIDWGDGSSDIGVYPNATTHTYPASGYPNPIAIVTITSSATSVTLFGSNGATWPGVTKLTAVSTDNTATWGLGTEVASFASLFRNALLLTSVPTDIPSSVVNMTSMFQGASVFNQNIGVWNVSGVTNMSNMFLSALAFNQPISGWDVSSVTNMIGMFQNASVFNQNVRYWSVQDGDNLRNMFSGATAFHTKFYPTTPGYNTTNATPLYTFFNVPIPLSLTFNNSLGSLQVRLPIIGTGVTATIDWGDGTTNTGVDPNVTTHTYPASGYPSPTAIVTITSSATSVTTFGSVGWLGATKLTAVATSNDATWGLGTGVISFANLFRNASILRSVPADIPSSVRNMSSMFQDALAFNQSISGWDVSSVTNMIQMFQNASVFNQNIRYWSVQNGDDLDDMFSGATAMIGTYTGTTGFGTTPLYTFFNVVDPPPCFLEGTQILCLQKNVEVYRNIQDLRKGDLVKTIYNQYVPIRLIGTSKLYNPGNDERTLNRLYKCSRENYPALSEDLYITGCHSILVPFITYKQADDTKAILKQLFVTDNHCRLMACVDEKAQPYNHAGCMNIYHVALEHYDEYMNYGIYANGLLVESCSISRLKYSNMRMLGEEQTSMEDASHPAMTKLIKSC